MSEAKKMLYKNILGNTKETIDAIQRYIEQQSQKTNNSFKKEDSIDSINRIIKSVADDSVVNDIEKIIKNL